MAKEHITVINVLPEANAQAERLERAFIEMVERLTTLPETIERINAILGAADALVDRLG